VCVNAALARKTTGNSRTGVPSRVLTNPATSYPDRNEAFACGSPCLPISVDQCQSCLNPSQFPFSDRIYRINRMRNDFQNHSISVLISVHQWLEKIHSPEPQATLSIPTKPQTTSSKSKSAQRKSLSYRVRATPSNRIHIRHQRPRLPLGASQTPPCVFFARCAFA
jgi:hypothetical protein